MKLLVIGGAGFMGSNYVRHLLRERTDVEQVIVYDKLTYAGRIENLHDLLEDRRLKFIKADLCDEQRLEEVVQNEKPDVIVNFAAETHVDRSINEPAPFIKTNIEGVFKLLEVVRRTENTLLVHISTDEVYGDREGKPPADEETAFKPSSPYAASKAAGDLLCQAYYRTYHTPVRIVRPSNNYGPYQHPEKLIPKTIIRALHNMPIPVYGDGNQVRDWLYVKDFCKALDKVIEKGRNGEAYNIPGLNPKKNIEVVREILRILGKPEKLIIHVPDRPGHDRVYAMKPDKILALGWKPETPWSKGIRETIEWYKRNQWWWKPLLGDKYFKETTPWKTI